MEPLRGEERWWALHQVADRRVAARVGASLGDLGDAAGRAETRTSMAVGSQNTEGLKKLRR